MDAREQNTRGGGKVVMRAERAKQKEKGTRRSMSPRLWPAWQWEVLALGLVVLFVGMSGSGRTFASLMTELQPRTEHFSGFQPTLLTGEDQPGQGIMVGEQDLLHSIELGELAHAQALLNSGTSANATDSHGWTALMLAALHNRLTLVPVLLAHGAHLDKQNAKGTTALMLAANNGHEAMVRLLLERGVQVNVKTSDGWTALMYAAWKGHHPIVAKLLRAKADSTVTDSQKWTALMYAAWQGHTATVTELLSTQEKRSRRGDERKHARALADQQGHREVVHLLDQMEQRG